MTLTELFDLAASRKASDIHLATGEAPRLRIGGDLVTLDEKIDLPMVLGAFLTPEGSARLSAGLAAERTVLHGDLAFVGIAFRVGDEGLVATFRILRSDVPPLDAIAEGALPLFRRIVEATRGLVLFVGLWGSGKTTTAYSVGDAINAERADRIFVVEDHPYLVFQSKKGMVTQIHVGPEVEGYARALDVVSQSDPDVVVLNDLPTLEALRRAMVLVETGHLVIANLNVPTPVDAVTRLLESAGEEASALRRSLAENLVAVTAQRLLPRVGGGKVPIYEWIANGPAVRAALLAGGDLTKVQSEDSGCRTLVAAVRDLFMAGKIGLEDAFAAVPPEGIEALEEFRSA